MTKILIVQVFGAIYNGHDFQQSFTVTSKIMLLKLTDSRINSLFSDAGNSCFRCTKRFLIQRLHRNFKERTTCTNSSGVEVVLLRVLLAPTQNALDHFQQLIEAKLATDKQPVNPKQLDIRTIFTYLAIQVIFFKLEKSQKVSVFSICTKTIRHLFDVTCYCHLLYSKSQEYTNQTSHDIGAL